MYMIAASHAGIARDRAHALLLPVTQLSVVLQMRLQTQPESAPTYCHLGSRVPTCRHMRPRAAGWHSGAFFVHVRNVDAGVPQHA